MHEPLGVPERQQACAELIRALEKCHSQSMWSRFTAMCNDEKHALNMCLRQERVDRTTRNREAAKERNAKKKQAWEQLAAEKASDVAAEAIVE